jgi:nitroreductase
MFMELISQRRSIRQFKDKPVEKKKIDLLIEAGLRSPSSRGINPWEFIVIQERQTLQRLSCSKPHGASFLKNAALGIVIIADPEKCDVWIEDSSIASTYIQLAAKSIGLESCWIQIRKRFYNSDISAEKKVAELLNISGHYCVESIIAIGYSDEIKKGHAKESLLYNKVHYEKYCLN